MDLFEDLVYGRTQHDTHLIEGDPVSKVKLFTNNDDLWYMVSVIGILICRQTQTLFDV